MPAFGRRDGEGLAVKGFEFSSGILVDHGDRFAFSSVPFFQPICVFKSGAEEDRRIVLQFFFSEGMGAHWI